MDELVNVGVDSLPRFLRRWYGEPRHPVVPARFDGPTALRAWHETTSQWDDVTVNNGPAEPELEDGKLVFWEENQGVWVWGTELAGDDPPVFERLTGDDPWMPLGEVLSTFLLHSTAYEALWGASESLTARGLTAAQLAGIAAGLTVLPMRPQAWMEPGDRLLAGAGVLVDLTLDRVTIAAPAADALEQFTEMPGIDWLPPRRFDAGPVEPPPDFLRP